MQWPPTRPGSNGRKFHLVRAAASTSHTDTPIFDRIWARHRILENEAGETLLVKYHWAPKQGVKSWTEADAAVMQGRELGVPRAMWTVPGGAPTEAMLLFGVVRRTAERWSAWARMPDCSAVVTSWARMRR